MMVEMAGTYTRASRSDPNTAAATVMAIGRYRIPSMPLKVMMGT